jgi:uncharacterized protein YukE
VQSHHDAHAYRQIEKNCNALARALDRMIEKLNKWEGEARKIEQSVENFYGD